MDKHTVGQKEPRIRTVEERRPILWLATDKQKLDITAACHKIVDDVFLYMQRSWWKQLITVC